MEEEHLHKEEPNNWSVVAESSFEEYVNIGTDMITSVVGTVDDIVSNQGGRALHAMERQVQKKQV